MRFKKIELYEEMDLGDGIPKKIFTNDKFIMLQGYLFHIVGPIDKPLGEHYMLPCDYVKSSELDFDFNENK